MKAIIVNPLYRAGKDSGLPVRDSIQQCGLNTGNHVFIEAVKRQLRYDMEVPITDSSLEGKTDCVAVMPSSNFLCTGIDSFLIPCIHLLERSKCSFTLIGVGAQSTKELNTPSKLVSAISPVVSRFFKLVSERAVSIGIRGEFTAECFEKMGIHNYRVIGCPSLFGYINKSGGGLKKPSLERCVVNMVSGNPKESRILQMAKKLQADWIMQSFEGFPEAVFENDKLTKEALEKNFPGNGMEAEEFLAFSRKKGHIFFSMKEWREFLYNKDFTFSFGSRFHGNVCALQCGIPALWLVHDSRTKELVEYLHLPNLEREKLDIIKYPEQLLELCDYKEFFQYYPILLKEYTTFLDENGLSYQEL